MIISTPGIYADIPAADYFADPCPQPSFTQSIGKVLLDRSPLHAKYRHPRLAPAVADDEDPEVEKYDVAKAIGNAAHVLMIGRGKDLAVGNFDAWRSKDAKTFRTEAEADGKTAILNKHFETAHLMVREARAQLDAVGCQEAFADGNGEVVAACQHRGTWCRTMIDWMVSTTRLWDFKTTGMSVAPHAIPIMMVNAGWDVQAAMQELILDEIDPDGRGRRKFRFVVQENKEPFALVVCELPESVMMMGRKRLGMALDIWRRCMASGQWPGYPTEVLYPQYPSFKETQWLEREIEHAERQSYEPAREPADLLMGG